MCLTYSYHSSFPELFVNGGYAGGPCPRSWPGQAMEETCSFVITIQWRIYLAKAMIGVRQHTSREVLHKSFWWGWIRYHLFGLLSVFVSHGLANLSPSQIQLSMRPRQTGWIGLAFQGTTSRPDRPSHCNNCWTLAGPLHLNSLHNCVRPIKIYKGNKNNVKVK